MDVAKTLDYLNHCYLFKATLLFVSCLVVIFILSMILDYLIESCGQQQEKCSPFASTVVGALMIVLQILALPISIVVLIVALIAAVLLTLLEILSRIIFFIATNLLLIIPCLFLFILLYFLF